MRLLKILQTPAFTIAAVFITAAAVASFVPSPWREGALLDLKPLAPDGLTQRVPLIAWPTQDETINTVQFDTSSSDASERTDAPPSKAEAPRMDASPNDSDRSDTATAPDAQKDDDKVSEPAAPDPDDLKLLASLRELTQQLKKRKTLLEIPCADPLPLSDTLPPDDLDGTADAPQNLPDDQATDEEASAQCTRYALDNFYASLRDRALGKAGHTRWMQYGDSLVIGDTLTGELRRLLQQQFGDGGHGWLYIGRPLRPVGAENIRAYPTEAWYVRTIVRHTKDAGDLFGLAGAEFRPTDDASLLIRSPRDGEFGKNLERFYLYYFAPSDVESASFQLTIDGNTQTENIEVIPGSSGVHAFEVPPGKHTIKLHKFSPKIRYYGVVSEQGQSGVVVDNLGLVSARQEHLLKLNTEQWRDQISFRDPDVISFFYGVNAASSNKQRMLGRRPKYVQNYREVIDRVMHNAPHRDCMILSLLTHGTREGDKIYPTGAVEVLNDAQRAVARDAGCAFFDTTGVMGGAEGTHDWATRRPPLLGADLSHPTRTGHHTIARHLYTNLMEGFIEYMERRIEAAEVEP